MDRQNAAQTVGKLEEQKIHLFCVIWMFDTFDKLVQEFGRGIGQACRRIMHMSLKDELPDSVDFQGFMVVKLAVLIHSSKFRYRSRIELPVIDHHTW